MKKQFVALTAIAALSVGTASQAFASDIHTVQSGETLWSISQDNHVSVEELQTWNELDSTLIYPSQQLKVEDVETVHIVKKGDTLFDIAKNNQLSVDELMKANNLSSDIIVPGDKLVLNGTKVASAHTTAQPATTKTSASAPAQTESAEKEMTVTATAYTAFCSGCSGITATGMDLRSNPEQKVIAVDPTVIPLGSRVWVEGYGEAIAGDVGSAIKGNVIDVFIPDEKDAFNWGRKQVNIKILD